MARRKKYPRLPNGYGSIKYLGKNRRNPYGVYPPVSGYRDNGSPIASKAICYVDTWLKGFAVLTAYKAGTYRPGLENSLSDNASQADFVTQILADYNRYTGNLKDTPTFAEVYQKFYEQKFCLKNSKKYSKSTMYSMQSAFKNCSTLHNRIFKDIRYKELQQVVDDCPLKHASKELIVNLIKQMYAYADKYDLIEKDYSAHLCIKTADDDEHGVPFSDKEIKILWDNKDNDIAQLLLIMIYSGFRIFEYKTLEIHLNEGYFIGGLKTDSGKNRIVPIHSLIYDLVVRRINAHGGILCVSTQTARKRLNAALKSLDINSHTFHDTRHTFSALCERYGVNEMDRKRMLGHKISDIKNLLLVCC